MQFGAIIIGDEIMSGKRQDKHMATVISTLRERGLELSWCQYLADEPALITIWTVGDGLTPEQLAPTYQGVLDAHLNAVNMATEWGGQGMSIFEQVLSQEQLGRSTNALWDVVWRPANVLRYCVEKGLDPLGIRMGVVVQRMIAARRSGPSSPSMKVALAPMKLPEEAVGAVGMPLKFGLINRVDNEAST